MKGILYVVATPIGNLEDITLRALNILKNVDLIAAEDTRQTLKLLNHFEISKPLISYHRHNEETKSDRLIEKLNNGENIALVSDAGTPGICDPGEEVIKKAIEEKIEVIPIPGACAFVNALIASGLDTKEFTFLGFLPLNKKLRKEKLDEINKSEKTIIIYEAPHKMKNTLTDLKNILNNRKIVLARELTKIHEEFIRSNIDELIENINNITYAEKSKIITDTIAVMDYHIESLSIDLLKFAIDNLEHDYSHSKKYILALIRKQVPNSCIEFNYLDKLNFFEDINELMYVCGIYYNNGIYDKPFRLLQIHKNFARKFSYKITNALVCERLHINKYVEQLEILVETTKCREKKCLLLAVLFVAYLNSDDSKKYLCIFDQLNKYYYKNYEDCENYLYLLRNISYYIDDVSVAVQNYEQCLYAFKLKDPVNYNRTVSNYLCYLMKHNFDNSAIAKLDAIAKETQEILEYNDEKYMYLNNNYGIYLMRYTCEDPSAYFSCIPYSTGTTETPYIYAQINLALYYEKVNPAMALYIMRDIQKLVEKTPVPRTKQFYNINLAMIEYSNGIFPQRLIEEIKNKPLRGNMLYAEQICTTYAFMNENNMRLTDEYRDILCLPGYLFYRYFDVKKLLFDL